MLAKPIEITRVLDANCRRDADAWVRAMAPEFTMRDPFGTTSDIQGIREHLAIAAESWGGFEYEILDYLREGDTIAASYRLTMTGKANGWEGRTVSFTAAAIVRVRDGLIWDWQEWFDTGVFRHARGVTASPAA